MGVRVIDRQPFRQGGGVEGLVGGYERHRPETGILVASIKVEDDGELHGVIGSEPVRAGNSPRIIEEGRG